MYREGRHVHKNTIKPTKTIMKQTMLFGLKIDAILMKKLVAAAFTAKLEKIAVVGPPVFGKANVKTVFF